MSKYQIRDPSTDDETETLADFIEGRKKGTRQLEPEDLPHRDRMSYVWHEQGMRGHEIAEEMGGRVTTGIVTASMEYHGIISRPGPPPRTPPWRRYGVAR